MNKKKPLISIIIPVFNTEQYIGNTIKSVVNQTFKDFEVIIINDGTKDNAISIAEKILDVGNINYKILNHENQGQGISRNVGVENSNGDWILFLDSDDIIQSDTLSLMNELIGETKPNVDFIFSNFQNVEIGEEFKNGGENLGIQYFDKIEIQELFLRRSEIILVPGTLYYKKWYIDNRYKFLKIPYSEDQLFMWDILLGINKVAKINKNLYNYLSRPQSIMSSSNFEQIVLGYPYFEEIQQKYQLDSTSSKMVSKYLLSRWVFGILHSSAKLCNATDYKKLLKKFEAKKHYLNLISFSDLKIRIFSYVCIKFPSLIFYLNKRL